MDERESSSRISEWLIIPVHIVDITKSPMRPLFPLVFLFILLQSAWASDQIVALNFRLCPHASSSLLRWSSGGSSDVLGRLHLRPLSLQLREVTVPLSISNHSWEGWTKLSLHLSGPVLFLVLHRDDMEPVATTVRVRPAEAQAIEKAVFHLGGGVCAESFVGAVEPPRKCDCNALDRTALSDTHDGGPRLLTRLRRSTDACNPSPCLHEKPCRLNSTAPGGYTCECSRILSRTSSSGMVKNVVTGWKGQNCSENIDECLSKPCLNEGVCRDWEGDFECLCGRSKGFYYTGRLCEVRIDQCRATHPDYNITGSTPVCERGNCSTVAFTSDSPPFHCACPKGYEGIRCSVDINECAPKPCKNNGTCTDLIGAYRCTCLPGFNGTDCEINIDECAPKPCKNGGRCTDLINAYSCNCSDTGFKGPTCEVNIDECEPRPCQNNATCTDGIKDYNCTCHPGYSGKNCSVDINECDPSPCHFNSPCYQKSDQKLYGDPAFRDLPPFNGTFDYTKAAGYVCRCVPGSAGENCSTNLDDCTPNLCQNGGRCEDLLNNYTCRCAPGYTGRHCEIDIDECAPRPCQNNAACVDRVADYECHCVGLFGGKNCSVALTGCLTPRCEAGGRCVPRLVNETVQLFSCVCPAGRTGDRCQLDTTLSFSALSWLRFNLSTFNNLSLDFRTTRGDVQLLAISAANFSLSLVGSRVTVNDGVPQGTALDLSSAPWLNIRVNDSRLFLAGMNLSVGAMTTLGSNVSIGAGFVGCVRDVKADGVLLQPDMSNLGLATNHSVNVGCTRTPQCASDPCGVGTRATQCLDLWDTYRCICNLGRQGDTCENETTAATFGFNNATSYLRYVITPSMRKFIADDRGFSLQLLLQAWPPSKASVDSLLAYFGTTSTESPVRYLLLLLTPSGHLKMIIESSETFNETFSTLLVANGGAQAVSVTLSDSANPQLTVSAPGVAEVSKQLAAVYRPSTVLSGATVLYLAGFKGSKTAPYSFGSTRVKRDAGTPVDDLPTSVTTYGGFRGLLLDARTVGDVELVLGNGTMVTGKSLVPSVEVGVKAGVVTEDVCALSTPCLNNGTCTNVPFNSFSCKCTPGWRGVKCEFVDYCNTTTVHCPTGYHCMNAPDQPYYECSGSISLTPSSPEITFTPTGLSSGVNVSEMSMRLRTRTATALTLLSLRSSGTEVGKVELLHTGLVRASRSGGTSASVDSTFKVNTGSWVLFQVNFRIGKMAISTTTTTNSFKAVPADGLGIPAVNAAVLLPDQKFKGCISSIHVNGFPFSLHTNFTDTSSEGGQPKWRPTLTQTISTLFENNKGECQKDAVCSPSPCLNSGKCIDLWNAFRCNCTTEFTGSNCSQPVCAAAPAQQPHSACLNNGECVAGATNFTCVCAEGFIGKRCASVNPCSSSPCKNGATCSPLITLDDARNESTVVEPKCNCTNGWTGPLCDSGTKGAAVDFILIFSIVGAVLVVIIVILIILIVRHVRSARSTRGIYDPHAQEMNGSHVYMANVIKPPPSERLI